MKRAQLAQYILAALTLVVSILSDPEILKWLSDHPWPAVAMLASPSFVTFAKALQRAAQRRRRPKPLPDRDTEPLPTGRG